jgi:O-antigen ligase
MFALFPFAGLGQSEFYRQSANHDLTHSLFLSIEQNGENAHNYFLQTMVETGILGFGAFLFLLLYPVIQTKDKRALIPAIVALLAIFSGNILGDKIKPYSF